MPKVSFILPAYKQRFLHEAIASILAQTYRDFELVVVDDCSPEDLKSVVDEFHDERLSYYRNETNIGGKDLVAAWNKALGYANGEWVVLASDDDVYRPAFLGKMMVLAERYPCVDAVHCRIEVIDSNGERMCLSQVRNEYESGLDMVYNLGCKLCRQVISDFMYRRAALLAIGGYVSRPRAWTSDESTAIALSLRHGVAYCNEVMFSWRMSGDNISSRFHDTIEKISANEQYRTWIKSLMVDYQCTDEGEIRIKDMIMREIDGGIDYRNMWALDMTHGLCWLKAIVASPIGNVTRWRYFGRRIRQLLATHPRVLNLMAKFLKI